MRESRYSRAALVEVIATLVCLVILLGAVVPLFIHSFGASSHAAALDDATFIAQNACELHACSMNDDAFIEQLESAGFEVSSQEGSVGYSIDGYDVSCSLDETANSAGSLHAICVDVEKNGQSIYVLSSAHYEPGGEA